MRLVSRPDENEGLGPDSFDLDELELIGAFMANVILGRNDKYKEAAFRIIGKLEDHFEDEEFVIEASKRVDPTIRVMDNNGIVVDIFSYKNIEFDV